MPPKAKPAWDSNIITPGTEFMHKLSRYLRFYVQDRVNRDKAWQNIKVSPCSRVVGISEISEYCGGGN